MVRARWSSAFFAFAMVVCGITAAACGSSARVTGASVESCQTGSTRPCTCANQQGGTQTCAEAQWAECSCSVQTPPPVCGDGVCGGDGETCKTCPSDCGDCPKCGAAPSCTSALGVPSSTTTRLDLCIDETGAADSGAGDGGGTSPADPKAASCKDPQLRLRLGKITTYGGGSTVYCVVNATDGVTSEAAVTAKTKALGDGETYYFDPTIGTFWGQKELHTTTNNLAITYNCFRVKGDSWSQVLQAGADEAAKAGGYAGPYGWAFGAAAIGASVAAAALKAASGDDLIFNAQQIVDRSKLLDLTNDRAWWLRKSHDGGVFGFSWDWQLTVESWGCADGVAPPM